MRRSFTSIYLAVVPVTCLICAVILFTACGSDVSSNPASSASAKASIESQLGDPSISEISALQLIQNSRAQHLDHGSAFWLRLADDTKLPNERRRRAIIQVFDSYVQVGMNLQDVSKMVAHETWLNITAEENPGKDKVIGGYWPLKPLKGHTLCFISVDLPEKDVADHFSVWLRVEGLYTTPDIESAVRGRPSSASDARISALRLISFNQGDFTLIDRKNLTPE